MSARLLHVQKGSAGHRPASQSDIRHLEDRRSRKTHKGTVGGNSKPDVTVPSFVRRSGGTIINIASITFHLSPITSHVHVRHSPESARRRRITAALGLTIRDLLFVICHLSFIFPS
ncbi:MAG TPA: hypothetical protein VE641_10910 [Chthoniobacterales bacterium]|nr:hypothetical protein [Chthoniobacterales bacterium]